MVHMEVQGTSSANHRDIQNNNVTMHKWSHKEGKEREREKEGKETVQGAKQKPHHIPTDSWQPAPPKNKSEMTIFRRDY
jgi:hypothetical protein